jgi:hypothetical protein
MDRCVRLLRAMAREEDARRSVAEAAGKRLSVLVHAESAVILLAAAERISDPVKWP